MEISRLNASPDFFPIEVSQNVKSSSEGEADGKGVQKVSIPEELRVAPEELVIEESTVENIIALAAGADPRVDRKA